MFCILLKIPDKKLINLDFSELLTWIAIQCNKSMSDLAFRAKNFSKQKALGQNFLIDESKLDAIVKASNLDPNKDIVVEIGAGIGFLTERLVKNCKKLYAIELDASTETHHKILEANYSHYKYYPTNKHIPQIINYTASSVSTKALCRYLDHKLKNHHRRKAWQCMTSSGQLSQ